MYMSLPQLKEKAKPFSGMNISILYSTGEEGMHSFSTCFEIQFCSKEALSFLPR